jgi:hypothetical protein
MKTGRPPMSSRHPLGESRWLSLALVTLLALPSGGFAVPRGAVSSRMRGSHAVAAPPAQLGFVFEVNTTGVADAQGLGTILNDD